MPLLDTSHIIGLIRKDSTALSIQEDLDNGRVYQYVSVITVFEMTAGAYRSSHPEEKISEIELIKQQLDVVSVSCSLAQVYAVLVYSLQKNGTRIGALDEIIAATALGTDGKIVTRDSHFLSCPGLEVIHY